MKLNEVVKSFLNSTKKSSDSSIVHPYKVSVDLTNNDFYSKKESSCSSWNYHHPNIINRALLTEPQKIKKPFPKEWLWIVIFKISPDCICS